MLKRNWKINNENKAKRKSIKKWDYANDYGDIGERYTHKKYAHLANRLLRRKARQELKKKRGND